MKTLLPVLRNLLTKNNRSISAALLLLLLLCVSGISQAQVVYTMGDPASGSSLPGDVVNRMNYDGSSSTQITNGATAGLVQPGQIALDGNNNRIFVSELYLSGNVIKVINATTGALIRTITSANSAYIKAIEYDVVNDWLYYTTEGGDVTVLTATDALFRVHADGSGSQTIATTLTKNPFKIALDVAGNKVYIMDVTFSGRSIKTIDLANGNAVTSRSFAASLDTIWDFAVDTVNGYIYYTCEGGNVLTLTTTDQLRRQNINGTGDVVLISSFAYSPYRIALDLGNNRAYVNDSYSAQAKIIAVNLTNNTYSTVLNLPNTSTSPTLADIAVPDQPKVTTTAASAISSTSATLAGNLVYGYGLNTERGVVYSTTNTTPTISDSKASMATNATNGAYSASVTGLSPSTTYYARAYAVNGAGTTYGAMVTFSTSSNDASLSGLLISAGTLTPGFTSVNTSYTALVANANSTITITPTKNNANASIQVNNVAATSGVGASVNLGIGDNAIPVKVTAQDGTTTKTYTITFTRPKAAQTITFAATNTKTYGDGDFAPGASASSGLGVSYSSDNLGVATIVSGQIHIVGAGTANITASQGGDANTLAASNVVQALTVNKASQTITFNAISAKTYGIADFAPGATASSGLTVSYSSDNAAVATIVSNQIHIVGQGTANITASQTGDANRLAATSVAQVLTVNKATVTITANAQTKVYGDNDPTFTYAATGVFNGDAPTGALSRVTPNTNRFIGIYAIDQGTLSYGGNYNITYTGANLTINKRPITVLPAAKAKVYGDADPFLNQFQIISGSLAPGDATGDQFGRDPGESVGTYLMTLGNKKFLTDGGTVIVTSNYDITVQPAYVTITAKPIIVSANAQTKNYGDADPTLSYVNDSLPFGDTFSGSLTRAPGEGFGTYAITKGTLALNSNYTLTFNGNNLTIGKKIINVTANAKTKTYGDPDPALNYTADALAFSESFTGSLTRDAGEGFGTYAINQGSLALSSNYTLNYTGASLNIGKKTINVTANAQTKIYGAADPAFTYTNDALVNSDTFTGTLTRDAGEDAGNHAITQGTLALSNNYTLNYTGANLAIGKGTLTYVANPVSRFFQAANPTFTGTVTGFISGETIGSATTGTLSFTSTATSGSAVGSYPINGEGLSATNYNFVQDAANSSALTIILSGDATLAGLIVDQGTLNPVFSSEQTSYGFAVANNVTSFNLTATVNQANASISINGAAVTSGSSKSIALNTGPNNLNVIVTAQDGSTTKYYTLNIFRAYDTNNLLASLNLSGLTYSPTFDTNTLNYTAAVGNLVTSTDVTATAVSPATHIFVGGYDLATTSPVTTSLNVGENNVMVVSKAENGDEKIYKVTVTRAQSSDATLASIGNNTITLNTPFVSGTHTYSATVPSELGALTFKPISTSDRASIQVNTQTLNPGPGNAVNLAFGANTVTIDVTSEDGTNHLAYVVNIYRLRSSDATLASLFFPFPPASINEPFDPAVYEYTATVTDSTYTGLPLTAVSANENAIVKIDGTVVPRFQNYTLPVHGGPNTYHIVVTSQDTSATKTYTLVLTRAGTPPPLQSPVANLYALNVSSGSTFSKNFNFTIGEELTTIYAPNNIASVRIFAVSENTVSTVTVNGVVLPYDTTTDLLPISVGDNEFTVVVTSEDGAHSKTYTLHITRLPFADVTLASLNISAGTLTPAFIPATRSYTVSVPNTVTSIGVTPVATVGTATVTIGATQINASNPTATVNLLEGPPNRVRIVVTAADGVTTQTYTVNVTREAPIVLSNNAAAVFVLNPLSTLTNTTGPATYNYTTSVSAEVSSINLKSVARDANAVIRLNGNVVASDVFSDPIPLNTGATVINVAVTAQDGVTVKTYSITVNRMGSNNAVASLKLTPSSTLISAGVVGTTTSYTTTVDPATSSVTITPTAQDAHASILVNGEAVVSGTASGPITLNVGSTPITVVVTAEDGISTRSYSVTVERLGSNNAAAVFVLNPLSILTNTTGSATYNYTTSVSAEVSSINLKTTARDANAVIRLNGNEITSGEFSDPIPLNTGATVINVAVTAQDGVTVKTYSITVNRMGSNNAVASLKLTPSSTLISAGVVGTTTSYNTTVDPATSSVTITPTAQDAHASILVNGEAVVSGTASGPITLNVGSTPITVVVTAEDGISTRSYSVTIERLGSNNAAAVFVLNPLSILTNTTGSATYNYTTSVSPEVSSINLKTTARDANAVIRLNGNVVTSGVFSDPILLDAGATVINVAVTAQDGVTVKTYSITVNRMGSNNAVASLKLTPSSTLVSTGVVGTTTGYTTTVAPTTSSVTVRPTAQDTHASILVNGEAVVSGTASGPITLNEGSTTLITVVVTAEDGMTTRTYMVNVTKPGGSADMLLVNRNDSKLLFANKTANNVAPTGDDGVVVHQGVSPNGDGSNDFLYIEGISAYPGNKLSIMNTSGTLVFDAKDYGKDGNHLFDGHSNKNGTLLKPGTYFYALEYQVDKQSKRKTGYIIIKY